MARKPPRTPEDRLLRWSRSMIPGTVTGRVAAASPLALDMSRLDATMRGGAGAPNLDGGTGGEFYRDRFELTTAGAQTVTLTYLPTAHSEHVYISGVEQDEGIDWTRNGQVISLLTAMDAQAAEVLEVRYAYLSGAPVAPAATDAPTLWSIQADKAANVYSIDALALIVDADNTPFTDVSADLDPGTGEACLVFGCSGFLAVGEDADYLFLRVTTGGGAGLWHFTRTAGIDTDTPIDTFALSSVANYRVNASGSTLTVEQGGVVVRTATLTGFDAAALSRAIVGLRGTHATGTTANNFSALGGVISDAYNRPDSPDLGTADTGQRWTGTA